MPKTAKQLADDAARLYDEVLATLYVGADMSEAAAIQAFGKALKEAAQHLAPLSR